MTDRGVDAAAAKVGTLVEALPYIRSYRGSTVVVKIGGAALEDPALASVVADDLTLLALVGLRLVVVHGGGPQVSGAMAAAGIEPSFVGGLRVTDERSMALVQQVLVGGINSDLVARLCKAGLTAVGLSGVDGGLVQARRTAGPAGEDLGRVGAVAEVRPQLLESLLDESYTPVIASVAPDADGAALNVNADAVAGAVAAAVGAAKLVYLTNVEGLYTDLGDSGSLVSEMKATELAGLVDGLSDGMRPKVTSAVDALRAGVGKVHILDGRVPHALLLEIFTDAGIGTQVLP
ncbi:MAG TPA: acetylglutamate kinase [Actinomycetota bacterium]